MAKHKYIKTPEALMLLFVEYKILTKKKPLKVVDWVGGMARKVTRNKEQPLTMEGFELFCYDKGFSVKHYIDNTNKAYDAYCTVCSRIRLEIRKDQIVGGMAGIYNPSITQRLNSLVDKSAIEHSEAKPLFEAD